MVHFSKIVKSELYCSITSLCAREFMLGRIKCAGDSGAELVYSPYAQRMTLLTATVQKEKQYQLNHSTNKILRFSESINIKAYQPKY